MKHLITNDQCLINTNEGVPTAHYLNNVAKRHINWYLLVFIGHLTFTLAVASLAAGQAGTDIAVLKAGVGARALGMGGAFTAIADNADATSWNPAGLSQISSNEITTMQTKLSTDTDHYYISFAKPFAGGTLGLSWIQVGLGNITQTSSEVNSVNEVQNLSIFSYFSNGYLLAYGREFNPHISVGLTAKYLTSDMFGISGGQGWGYSVTPGLLIKMPKLTVGVKVDELLNQQSWGTGTIEKVRPKLRLGLAYIAPNPGTFSVDISQTIRADYAPEVAAGYELINNELSFRCGIAEGGLTAGAGFQGEHARVDYAYVTQRALSKDNVHRVSLSGRW